MQVKDFMTPNPASCTPDTSLRDVAKMMVDNNCGEIPVVESNTNKTPVGVITDRDIVCRTVAKDLNPLDLTAADCMTEPCITVQPEMSLEECCKVMQDNQIRRVPVVDAQGSCCGIVALADVALQGKEKVSASIVKEVSEPGAAGSAAGA